LESGGWALNLHLEERWIPKTMIHEVQKLAIVLNKEVRVSELIDFDTNWWNIELVHNVFNAEKEKEICGMVVCPWSRIDKMVWAGSKDGEFIVCSG
jgi:hypothetical protein